MADREQVIAELAQRVRSAASPTGCRVAVDGVDGAGKTVLADELAAALQASGVPAIRVSIDGFRQPRSVRYRRGRDDPEGLFRDSYDYEALVALVLGSLDLARGPVRRLPPTRRGT